MVKKLIKVDQLIPKNQPSDWYSIVTNGIFNEYKKSFEIITQKKSSFSTIVDAGCNVGGFYKNYSNLFQKWLCVDASSYNINQFKQNHDSFNGILLYNALYKNDHSFVKLKKYINENQCETCSGDFGIVDFYDNNKKSGWISEEYEQVSTISLETILKICNFQIDLMKVDIEGSEFDFLYGKNLQNIENLIIEMHNFLGDNKIKLEEWLDKTHKKVYTQGDGIIFHEVQTWIKK